MRASYNVSARKRPVKLTLNEDLVTQARRVTDNLSSVVRRSSHYPFSHVRKFRNSRRVFGPYVTNDGSGCSR